jgi:hypothetical protein
MRKLSYTLLAESILLSEAFFRLTHTDRVLAVGFQTLFRGFFVTNFSLQPCKDISSILASGDDKVYDLCLEIGLLANSLDPLEKLQTLGFTPDAISDLYTECGEDIDRMIDAIQELE